MHRLSLLTAAIVIVVAFVSPGVASAAPGGWDFRVTAMPAGVSSGGQLALDQRRGQLFVTDNTFPATTTKEGLTLQKPNVDVSVVSLAARRPVRSIDLADQPWGLFKYQSVQVPMPQIADGIAVDSAAGRLVTTSAHANGVSIVGVDARKATPRDLVAYPGGHPMGVVAAGGRAWVAMFSADRVVLLDTATRRQIAQVPVFRPTLLSLDSARHRLYVGNDDHKARKRNFVTVIDTRTNRVIREIATPSNSRPTVDPVTGRVFAVSFDTGAVSVIDPDSLRVVKTIATGSTPNQLAVDGRRRLGYMSNLDKRSITVVDLALQQLWGPCRRGLACTRSLSISAPAPCTGRSIAVPRSPWCRRFVAEPQVLRTCHTPPLSAGTLMYRVLGGAVRNPRSPATTRRSHQGRKLHLPTKEKDSHRGEREHQAA